MLLSSSQNIRKIRNSLVLGIALSGLLTTATIISNTENALAATPKQEVKVSQNSSKGLQNKIEQAVIKDAAQRAKLKISDVEIIQTKETTFSNVCLFKFGEICTKEYRPVQGWIVVVKVKAQSWTYHVNKYGSQILLDPKVINNKLPENLANIVLSDAAKRANLPIKAVKITQATEKTFSNACVFNFGEVCTQQYDPISGWEVTVNVKGKSLVYHIDVTGSKLVLGKNQQK